jgi:hypothetical protein
VIAARDFFARRERIASIQSISALGKSRHRRMRVLSSPPTVAETTIAELHCVIPEGIGMTQLVVLPFPMIQGNGSAALLL